MTTFAIGSPQLQWRVALRTPARISAASVERVEFGVYAESDGQIVDVTTGYAAEVGFTADPAAPPATWSAATWDTTIIGTYVAGLLVGDGGAVQLAAGEWYAWVRVTTVPSTAQSVVRQAGRLLVY